MLIVTEGIIMNVKMGKIMKSDLCVHELMIKLFGKVPA